MSSKGSRATAAVVARNDKGALIDGTFSFFSSSSVLRGELEALRKACFLAKDFRRFPVTVESDSKMAISLSVSELVPPWEVHPVVMDIRELHRQHNFEFVWVRRWPTRQPIRWPLWQEKGSCLLTGFLILQPLCLVVFYILM
ncbi:hypothetical protein RHMOL_Rhmol08G0291300 [Rhododendron molle]|uniref:Uncharacterized protein n=1 Tax=Rhododendron molle TaxID=49168 RepID=A0ACC0MTM5_RHOML|nr:hypothetical protein RHMOL_Rhmol08G0291300 [Rhododendron molle]